MLRQADLIHKIQIGKEFRIPIPNNRIYRVRSSFSGAPITVKCTTGTGIFPPAIILIEGEGILEMDFSKSPQYLNGQTYTFLITEQETVINEYVEPPKKTVAHLQYTRAEIEKSQLALEQKFTGPALSFDQSYYSRTLGQIEIQRRFERKYGALHKKYNLISGSGFGVLQAASCALGYDADELGNFMTANAYTAISGTKIGLARDIIVSVLRDRYTERISHKRLEKEIRKYFKEKDAFGNRTNRDLTVKEFKTNVFFPIWDMSGMTLVVTKDSHPDMPIYSIVCASVFDPVFFTSRSKHRQFKNLGVINVDIVKNNDVYLKKANPNMVVHSIGSPARRFNKGFGDISERDALISMINIKHDTDLDWSRSCGSLRFECKPVDELEQFPQNRKAIDIAKRSGCIDV